MLVLCRVVGMKWNSPNITHYIAILIFIRRGVCISGSQNKNEELSMWPPPRISFHKWPSTGWLSDDHQSRIREGPEEEVETKWLAPNWSSGHGNGFYYHHQMKRRWWWWWRQKRNKKEWRRRERNTSQIHYGLARREKRKTHENDGMWIKETTTSQRWLFLRDVDVSGSVSAVDNLFFLSACQDDDARGRLSVVCSCTYVLMLSTSTCVWFAVNGGKNYLQLARVFVFCSLSQTR